MFENDYIIWSATVQDVKKNPIYFLNKGLIFLY